MQYEKTVDHQQGCTMLTRRQLLLSTAAVTGSLVASGCRRSAAVSEPADLPVSLARSSSFDEGWRFHRGDAAGAEQPGFDDSTWRALDLPHDWRIEDLPYAASDDGAATADPSAHEFQQRLSAEGIAPLAIGPFDGTFSNPPVSDPMGISGRAQGWTVGGTGWYRKHFELQDLPAGRHVELRFDGVYRGAEVWLNGVFLGDNAFGYIPFGFDLTPYLRPGRNVLAVRVDNTGPTSRWYTGSGIYRHTWLTVTGPLRIATDGVYVTTPAISPEQARVQIVAELRNLSSVAAPASLRVTLLDPDGRSIASATTPPQLLEAAGEKSFELDLAVPSPSLWSLDAPRLYAARTEVLSGGEVVDQLTTRFGIRSIVADAGLGLLLNGQPVKLRGVCVHHDHGPLGAVALDRSEYRRIEILKAGGFNAYRTGHCPPTPATLEACDRLGMLVYDEFVDAWDIPKGGALMYPGFAERWQQDLTRFIRRDRNHPSVIIWSIGNEIFVDPNGRGAQMAAVVRALDPTRLLCRGGFYDDATWQYADIGDEHYNSDPSAIRAAHPDKLIVQSESYASRMYEDWAFEQAHPWAIGNFVWTGWDHIGEAGVGAPVPQLLDATLPGPFRSTTELLSTLTVAGLVTYPWVLSFAGDYDLIGQRKPQNYWRQVIYGMSPIEMLVERPLDSGLPQGAGGWCYYDELPSWTWDVPPGKPLRVRVYTSGDRVALFLNGAAIGENTLSAQDALATTFMVPYSAGSLLAIAYKDGREIGRRTLETTGSPHALRLSSDVAHLTTGRDDLAHVLVEVVDANDRRVPDAVVRVGFEVLGAGTLAGVANANPHNADSFQRPRRHTWHGQALAIVRPAKTEGVVSLRATAEGLRPGLLTLPVLHRESDLVIFGG